MKQKTVIKKLRLKKAIKRELATILFDALFILLMLGLGYLIAIIHFLLH